MSFLSEAARLISEQSSPFFGTSDQRLLVLHHSFAQHYRMHRDAAGQTTSLTMRREAERAFRAQHDVTEAQYKCLAQLYNEGEVGDIAAVYECSLEQPSEAAGVHFVDRYFTVPVKICCGTAMRPCPIQATFYDQHACGTARHYAMKCQGQCGASYHLNKRVVRSSTPEHDLRVHEFYPWVTGEQPAFIATRSGRAILSTELLTEATFTMSRMRCDLSLPRTVLDVTPPFA